MIATETSVVVAAEGCREVCRRCEALVGAVRTAEPRSASGAWRAVGPHLRHCVDHFTALLRGLPGGTVDYDARDRDPELERDPERMLETLREIDGALAGLDPGAVGQELRVLQLAASGAAPQPVASTLERELVFLSSHTIHHLALVIHLAAAHGVEVAPDLGVAFSTAAYRAGAADG